MRVEKGLDRHELAQAVGMSYSSLYRLESGLVRKPPLWWYQNCAIVLGVELEDILDHQHQGWQWSPQAPRPPDSKWLKAKAEAKRQKSAQDRSAKLSKSRAGRQRLRNSGLAAGR